MGGGGVIRAAAKVAGVGVVNSAIRGGVNVVPPVEQSVCKAASSRPFSAMMSSSSNNVSEVTSPIAGGLEKKNSWEMIDDWEFESDFGGGAILASDLAPEPKPRLVFGGAPPSLEETKAATRELKDAVEKVYLSNSTSPRSIANEGSVGFSRPAGLSIACNDSLETRTLLVNHEQAPVVPVSAMKAFSLLSESPAAQTVVASIAADANVWKAVMENKALMDFLQAQKNTAPTVESVADYESSDWNSPTKFYEVSDESDDKNPPNGLLDIIENFRLTVVDLVRNVSDFFQSLFGFSAGANGNSSSIFMDKTVGASFMALAVMVIMVVVVRRG